MLPRLGLAMVLVAVCGFAAAAQNGGGLDAAGKDSYEVHCSSCHGLQAQGSPNGPSLAGVGAAAVDFSLTTGRMPANVTWEQQLHGPPAFSPERIAAITRYVTSLAPGGPPIPSVSPVNDAASGRELYEVNCEACHGVYGQGAVVGFGRIAPDLWQATPLQIAEAVRIGPGVMPRFGSDELSNRDLGALAGYVTSLRAVTFHPGGWEIGRIGPVAEGFIAWIFGLGSLYAVVRYLGTPL